MKRDASTKRKEKIIFIGLMVIAVWIVAISVFGIVNHYRNAYARVEKVNEFYEAVVEYADATDSILSVQESDGIYYAGFRFRDGKLWEALAVKNEWSDGKDPDSKVMMKLPRSFPGWFDLGFLEKQVKETEDYLYVDKGGVRIWVITDRGMAMAVGVGE
ncbi:hypothetical protein JD969_05110 [Planctomycetota bacterium]|nr:hypothetical protein JD969_05110 [Planctomycetota bacterium]